MPVQLLRFFEIVGFWFMIFRSMIFRSEIANMLNRSELIHVPCGRRVRQPFNGQYERRALEVADGRTRACVRSYRMDPSLPTILRRTGSSGSPASSRQLGMASKLWILIQAMFYKPSV